VPEQNPGAQGLESVVAQLALLPGVLEQRDAARQLPLTLARRRGCMDVVHVLRAAGTHERGAESVRDGAAPCPPLRIFSRFLFLGSYSTCLCGCHCLHTERQVIDEDAEHALQWLQVRFREEAFRYVMMCAVSC